VIRCFQYLSKGQYVGHDTISCFQRVLDGICQC
jgi:hypothetical protein